jgi:asparaginyl-tRNA synthetase
LSSSTVFFENEGFIQTHPPIITSSDCEGAGEVFTVTSTPGEVSENNPELFFREPKYLTVSSQLHLEALSQSVGKVWTLAPTFRAEKSDTTRHLSEFYMLEAEISFSDDLHRVMDVVERLLTKIASRLNSSQVGGELLAARDTQDTEAGGITRDMLQNRWLRLIEGRWPRISYAEAVTLLQDASSRNLVVFDFPPTLEAGLQAEHEKYIAETVGKSGPVFVTDYPRDIKAFYMSPSLTAPGEAPASTVSCFDLLVPELCEIAGGSMREHRLGPLLMAMEKSGLLTPRGEGQPLPEDVERTRDGSLAIDIARVPESLRWYVDLRRYGSVPHGGFGLGFDRLLCYLSGVSSIRDIVSFPRWHGRCDC